jgi:hypothetical protein
MPKVVSFETKRGVLKCYTHFKRDRPDLSNDAFIKRLMDWQIEEPVFTQSKMFIAIKNVLLLCHLSKLVKITCYSCQILKLFLMIVFLITLL